MIHFRCQCGIGHSVQHAVVAEFAHCPSCRAPIRLVWAGPVPADGEFRARLIARSGPLARASQIIIGGSSPIEVGTLPGKHLHLPGELISGNQCRLVPFDEGWQIEDTGSSNGSYLNGIRVSSHPLRDGDILDLGEYELEFRIGNTAPRAATAARQEPAATYQPTIPLVPSMDLVSSSTEAMDEPIPLLLMDRPIEEPGPIEAARLAHWTPAHRETSPPASDDFLDPNDYGSYDIAPPSSFRAAPSPGRIELAPSAPLAPRRGRDAVVPGPPPVCPACGRTLLPRAKICVDCGVDVRTGRTIITAQGLDEDQLYGNAETLVSIVSWVVPFGLYPIASEAFGKFKPFAIWAIAGITILFSVCFWAVQGNLQGPGRQLMLWAGRPTPQEIQAIYTQSDLVSGSNQFAYEQKVKQLQGTVPKERLPLAAYEALPEDQQVYGHFEPYQFLTCTLLHGGIMHLAGNMLFLLVFGSRVNAVLGQWKTAVLYPIMAVAAGIGYCMAESGNPPMPSIGASGAIMGLAGMYLVLFPVHKVHNVIWFRISPLWAPFLMLRIWFWSGGDSSLLRAWMKLFALRGFWVVLFFIGFDVFFTLLGIKDHVAHWAHLGGFIGGFAIGVILLITRMVDVHGGDLLSVVLGKHAWGLVGKPGERMRSIPGAEIYLTAPNSGEAAI